MSTSRPPTPASAPLPIQASQIKLEDLQQPGVPFLNQLLAQHQNVINYLLGAAGKTILPSGIDVAGATVSGVGAPQSPTDAVSKAHAEANYSAEAIAPQLESGGKFSLKTVRNLNSKAQQEHYSTFLNAISNTAPTTNTTIVQAGVPGGGSVSFTIPAGNHKLVDGSIIPFGTFTDTVLLPTTQAVTSFTRVSGLVTATGTFTGLVTGDSIYELGASDPSFDGTFTLLSASGMTLTWSQPFQADSTATGGNVSTGGVYIVFLRTPSHQLAISGPAPVDSQENRLAANVDGQVLIAVVVVNGSGVVTTESAAGATAPAATNGNRVVSRL